MTKLAEALKQASADLLAHGARSALVGGLAVSVRTEPRTTRDADFVVAVASDDEAESLVRSMLRAGYEVSAGVEHIESGRLATVRLWPPGDRSRVAIVDLLFASSGIEQEIVGAAEPLHVLDGLVARVAVVGHLIALKVLARDDRRRPQDRVDLAALLRVADAAELRRAEQALSLIESRGFARGRDLRRGLQEARSEFAED